MNIAQSKETNKEIHGHEVIYFLVDSGPTPQQAFIENLIEHFGDKTTYYTCSAKNLNAYGIVDLLIIKGKFIKTANGLTTDIGKVCKH